MSREIKFRGYSEKDDEWRYGFYVSDNITHEIQTLIDGGMYCSRVDPESVGQFTGLRDVNGVEIYEFDLLQDSMGKIAVVTWFKSNAEFELLDAEEAIFNGLDCEEPPYQIDVSGGWVKLKVIGNAFEHPHLLDDSK